MIVLVAAAAQGIRVSKAHEDDRLFGRALTVAKVHRFGTHRQTRFDNWARTLDAHAQLRWIQSPRAWFQDGVPLRLDIHVNEMIVRRYQLIVHVDAKTLSAADAETDGHLKELQRWAVHSSRTR
ncbi:MAG: hypothetical protein VX589_02370 [Myxococcota bacterium]|nr:hypothetical protein [Myxococcota bacterium]